MGKDAAVPRYVFPSDMPSDLDAFTALGLPLAWGIVRHLAAAGHSGATLRELCDALGSVDDATVTRRLDALLTAGFVLAEPPERRQGHRVTYRLAHERLDALVGDWLAYLRHQDS